MDHAKPELSVINLFLIGRQKLEKDETENDSWKCLFGASVSEKYLNRKILWLDKCDR